MQPMQPMTPLTSIDNSIGQFLSCLIQNRRVHAKSLVSTFFGDTVVPNDGYVWIETVFAALELLGVNKRRVRTTLFRLREEAWVEATRSGRKSYYQLTKQGDSHTRLAERRIYYRDLSDWDGSWTLVFLVLMSKDAELRVELENELGWVGFGSVTKNVWAHPGTHVDVVTEKIGRLGLIGKVIVMRCENIHDHNLGLSIDDRELAAMCMQTSKVESLYKQFIEDFSPLIDDNGDLTMRGSNAEMLSLRLLMMDEYRRVTLRDPHLPTALLPDDWAGNEAFVLCAKIYKQVYKAANGHYQTLQKNAGAIEKPHNNSQALSNYATRFII